MAATSSRMLTTQRRCQPSGEAAKFRKFGSFLMRNLSATAQAFWPRSKVSHLCISPFYESIYFPNHQRVRCNPRAYLCLMPLSWPAPRSWLTRKYRTQITSDGSSRRIGLESVVWLQKTRVKLHALSYHVYCDWYVCLRRGKNVMAFYETCE